MRFTETPLPRVYLIDVEYAEDERGWFARGWCRKEFEAHGLNAAFVQCNLSFTRRRHTIRGLHYQVAPNSEAKLVRCTRGAMYDVVVDLRPGSPTYKQWFGVELSDSNRRMLYVSEGCAHGFQTLVDDTEVFYPVTGFYAPESERGVRWDDPAFGIVWPAAPHRIVSAKDRRWPDHADEPSVRALSGGDSR